MGGSNRHCCCCTPCADGGNCSLPHNHAGEHYSDKETMLDFMNPARHDLAAKDAEIARLKAAVERLTWERDDARAEVMRRDRALAAGPAALRKRADEYPGHIRLDFHAAATIVGVAQEAAMKEGK